MRALRGPAALIMGLALLLPGTGEIEAQRPTIVVTRGASDVAVDRRLSRLLDGEPLVLASDTAIARGDTVRGPVLVLDATLILEGVITGDLVLVDAGAFVRPGAVVGGDLVNVAGGLYRSELARVGGVILDLPTAAYRVEREQDRLVIVASDSPSPLVLDGFYGLAPPTYDRVNGITAVVGARYTLPMVEEVTPSIHGRAGWRTEIGEPTFAVSAELRRFGTILEGGYYEGWATNDDWIRGDLKNALNYAWDGDDLRDYFEVDRSWVGMRREFGDLEKSLAGSYGIRAQLEDATSLPGDDPWHLLSGEPRPNPSIDAGRTTSLIGSVGVEWLGQQTAFQGGIEYEAARSWLEGDFDFDRISARGDWAMHALANHTLEIEFFVQQPLGGDALPRQEWSFVGGSGTLQTVELAAFRGDRVVFVETKYIVPFPDRVALPIVGAPELQLIHATGMAWSDEEDSSLRQEVGARLQFFAVYFRYMVEPADLDNNKLDVGLSMPFGTVFPWERR